MKSKKLFFHIILLEDQYYPSLNLHEKNMENKSAFSCKIGHRFPGGSEVQGNRR